MSRILREGHASDYKHWRVPSVEEGTAAAGAAKGRTQDGAGLLTAERIEEIHRQAREAGYAAGFEQGFAEALEDIEKRAALLDAIMRGLAKPLEHCDEQVEEEIVSLAMSVAQQLVRREIRADPGQIIAVVREAMAVLPSAARAVELRLHPEDASLVREVLHLSDKERSWQIIEDPVLTRGGCRVVSDMAQVDASIESRLNAVIAAVLGNERDRDGSR